MPRYRPNTVFSRFRFLFYGKEFPDERLCKLCVSAYTEWRTFPSFCVSFALDGRIPSRHSVNVRRCYGDAHRERKEKLKGFSGGCGAMRQQIHILLWHFFSLASAEIVKFGAGRQSTAWLPFAKYFAIYCDSGLSLTQSRRMCLGTTHVLECHIIAHSANTQPRTE